MPFTASYDSFTKTLSTMVCLGFLAIIFATHNPIISTLAIVVILISFAYSPRGYVLADRSILVRRLSGPVRIRLEDVREVRRATPDDLRGCVRLRGSGGLFGYYGLFRSSKLGRFTEYVTNRNNTVVVITGSKTALFSPDDVDGFLAAIRVTAPVQASSPVPIFDAPRRAPALPAAIGITIGMAAIGVVAAASSYSPGSPSYTLTPAALTIHDRFYPVTLQADAVDISQIRVVDFAQDPSWIPNLRTNGFANSHYQSGWFRVANGEKVRLYRSGGQRLVLLPAKTCGAPVLYQAEDPVRFAGEVRAVWTGQAQARGNAGK
jgi:hypothetical protein